MKIHQNLIFRSDFKDLRVFDSKAEDVMILNLVSRFWIQILPDDEMSQVIQRFVRLKPLFKGIVSLFNGVLKEI